MLKKRTQKTALRPFVIILLIVIIGGVILLGTNECEKQELLYTPVPANSVINVNPDDFRIEQVVTPPSKTGAYTEYLNGLKKPDYEPTVNLCHLILKIILDEHLNPVNREMLLTGVKEEIKTLLFDAEIDYRLTEMLPPDETIFQTSLELFGGKVDEKLILSACINGMLSALNDPYSEFLGSESYENFLKKNRQLDYRGVGLRISKAENSAIHILEVFKDTPAEKAGIRKNDIIENIDNISVFNLSLEEIAGMIECEDKADVNLVIRRHDNLQGYDLYKDNIVIPVVTTDIIADRYGYIKIESFKEELYKEFKNAYISLEDEAIRGLILDLRNNPGGLVESAQDLCGFFLPRNSIIALFKNRKDRERIIRSRGRKMVYVPVVLLVNCFTASSSEITAGALRDHKVVTVIGTTTQGKGSVQKTFPVKDQGAVKLTTEQIYTPKGFLINGKGIESDIVIQPEIAMSYDEDVTLKKAVEFLREKTEGRMPGGSDKNVNSDKTGVCSESYKVTGNKFRHNYRNMDI
jgi:carboxyl-terminal processing protease